MTFTNLHITIIFSSNILFFHYQFIHQFCFSLTTTKLEGCRQSMNITSLLFVFPDTLFASVIKDALRTHSYFDLFEIDFKPNLNLIQAQEYIYEYLFYL